MTNIDYNASTDVRFGFDALNRMTNMVDAAGTTAFTWTAGNQLLTEDGPFSTDTVTNIYVNRLRVGLSVQQPTGSWTNGFGYDTALRLTNVAMSAGSFGCSYVAGSASKLPLKILLPNTSYIMNNYDGNARLLTTALNNSTNGSLDSYTYVYNPANQRTNLTRTDGSTVAFSYDQIGQLTFANCSVNTFDVGYHYDAAWNLDTRTNNGVLSNFTVDSKNQISTCPDGVASYDNNGNLTATTSPTSYTLGYDDENRMTSAKSGTSWRYDFSYDGLGRKRTRTDYTWNGSSWVTGSITQYIYDGKRVIEERVSGTPTVAYARGIDLSGSMEGAGGIGGLLARSSSYASGNFTNHNYYHADGNGNVTYMVNGSQTLAASYRYDPFGNLVATSGTLALANTFRFSSKEVLSNGGLYDFLYRWYAPNMQRWLTRDLLPNRGGIGLYTFCANGSLNNVDIDGLTWRVTSDPSKTKDATLVCGNNGRPVPKVPADNPKNLLDGAPSDDPKKVLNPLTQDAKLRAYFCIQKCKRAHEQEHIKDVLAENPDICVGATPGTAIINDDPAALWNSEVNAHGVEETCLKNCQKTCPSPLTDKYLKDNEEWIAKNHPPI